MTEKEKKKKSSTVYIDGDVLEQLSNLVITIHGVTLKSNSDKIRYLLFEHNDKKN